jgi:hypothetical protein
MAPLSFFIKDMLQLFDFIYFLSILCFCDGGCPHPFFMVGRAG